MSIITRTERQIASVLLLILCTGTFISMPIFGIAREDNESFYIGFSIFLISQCFVFLIALMHDDPAYVLRLGKFYMRFRFSMTPLFYINRDGRKCTQYFELGTMRGKTMRVCVFQFLTFAFHIGVWPQEKEEPKPEEKREKTKEEILEEAAAYHYKETYTHTSGNMTPEMQKQFDTVFASVDRMSEGLSAMSDDLHHACGTMSDEMHKVRQAARDLRKGKTPEGEK